MSLKAFVTGTLQCLRVIANDKFGGKYDPLKSIVKHYFSYLLADLDYLVANLDHPVADLDYYIDLESDLA
ncbi:MAG: hypothetical protein ACI8WB_003505 [Phenylobacterium sp.]|jgi:hypothetical protein